MLNSCVQLGCSMKVSLDCIMSGSPSLVSLTIVHPVVELIPPCMQAFCSNCMSCCIVLDSHVYAKCILCLRKDVHSLIKTATCNFRLQMKIKPLKFCYTGQTAASRIGFWYSYKQCSEMFIQEVATCSYF